jgi:hypothetical protein
MLLFYLLWVSSQHLLGHRSIKRPKPKFVRFSNGTKTHYNAEHSFCIPIRFALQSTRNKYCILYADLCRATCLSFSLSSLYTSTLCRVFANEILKGTVKSRHRENKPIASPVNGSERASQSKAASGMFWTRGRQEKRREGGKQGNKRYTDLWSLSVHREQRRGWERYWL